MRRPKGNPAHRDRKPVFVRDSRKTVRTKSRSATHRFSVLEQTFYFVFIFIYKYISLCGRAAKARRSVCNFMCGRQSRERIDIVCTYMRFARCKWFAVMSGTTKPRINLDLLSISYRVYTLHRSRTHSMGKRFPSRAPPSAFTLWSSHLGVNVSFFFVLVRELYWVRASGYG